jgi:hypothetical protein
MGFDSPNPTLTKNYKRVIIISKGENKMRGIDSNRFIAMNEIKMRSNEIEWLSDVYKNTYKDEASTGQEKINVLDDLWRLITENQIRLTEILRENGL